LEDKRQKLTIGRKSAELDIAKRELQRVVREEQAQKAERDKYGQDSRKSFKRKSSQDVRASSAQPNGGRQTAVDKKRHEEEDKTKIEQLEKQLDAYNQQVFTLQIQIKHTRTQLKSVIDEARKQIDQ